jgi:hypothetical protein
MHQQQQDQVIELTHRINLIAQRQDILDKQARFVCIFLRFGHCLLFVVCCLLLAVLIGSVIVLQIDDLTESLTERVDALLTMVNLLLPTQSRAEKRYERELQIIQSKDLLRLRNDIKSVCYCYDGYGYVCWNVALLVLGILTRSCC